LPFDCCAIAVVVVAVGIPVAVCIALVVDCAATVRTGLYGVVVVIIGIVINGIADVIAMLFTSFPVPPTVAMLV